MSLRPRLERVPDPIHGTMSEMDTERMGGGARASSEPWAEGSPDRNDQAQPRSAAASRLRRQNRVVVAIPALVAIIGIVLSQMWIAGLANEYTSSAALAFAPKPSSSGAVPGSESLAVQAAKYIVFLDAEPTIQTASNASGIPSSELEQGGLGATIIPGTATLMISVTASSPDQAAMAANSFADQVVDRAKGDSILTVDPIVRATAPDNPSGPPRAVLGAAGLFLSLVTAVVILVAELAVLRLLRSTPPGRRLPAWWSSSRTGETRRRPDAENP